MSHLYYEWDIETVTKEDDPEVIDHWHADQLCEYAPKVLESALNQHGTDDTKFMLVLVRNDDNGRSWAYVDQFHNLPPFFKNAYENDVARVPQRFVRELKKYATNFKESV